MGLLLQFLSAPFQPLPPPPPTPHPRYDWQHAVRREDIEQRRIAVTLRELGPDFQPGGCDAAIGRELIERALTYAGEPIEMGPDGRR